MLSVAFFSLPGSVVGGGGEHIYIYIYIWLHPGGRLGTASHPAPPLRVGVGWFKEGLRGSGLKV